MRHMGHFLRHLEHFFWRYRTVNFAIHPDIYTRWHMKNLKILALKYLNDRLMVVNRKLF